MGKFVDRLSGIAGALSGMLLFCIGALVLFDVVARLSGHSVAAAPDWIVILLVWSTLLGLAYAHRHGAHVSMDLVLETLSPARRRIADIVVELLIIVTLVVILWSCIESTRFSFLYTSRMVSSRIPMYVPQLALVVGVLLFLMQSLVRLARLFGRWK